MVARRLLPQRRQYHLLNVYHGTRSVADVQQRSGARNLAKGRLLHDIHIVLIDQAIAGQIIH